MSEYASISEYLPPTYGTHLPGGMTAIEWAPAPRWPMEHRNVRALHGAISTICGHGHRRWPSFTIRRHGDAWAVYWSDEATAARVAGASIDGMLFDRPTTFRIGPLFRMRAPSDLGKGIRTVRIDTLSPVVISCYGRTVVRECPTDDSLMSSISGEILYRLSPSHCDEHPKSDPWARWMKESIKIKLVSYHTHVKSVSLGGKFGSIPGWAGKLFVECNAPAHWVLVALERGLGLGGRTAFGFGQIRVTPC